MIISQQVKILKKISEKDYNKQNLITNVEIGDKVRNYE